jgi:predicted DNA-binding transcriptional regulator YafY
MTALGHSSSVVPGEADAGQHVDLEHLPPSLIVDVEGRNGLEDADVVDEDVDTRHSFEELPRAGARADIRCDTVRPALGRDANEAQNLATSTIVAEPDAAVGAHLRTLVTSARKRERVEIDYVSASRHQSEHRPVDPYGIVHHAGEWYVVGHCHNRGDVRTFRIDRIASLKTSGQRFDRPADFDLEAYRRERLYVPSADAINVRIFLDPLAVTRIGANWPVGEVTMQDDGSAELLVDCEGLEWVTAWVLGLGRHAWIVGPEEAREAMRNRIVRLRAELAA